MIREYGSFKSLHSSKQCLPQRNFEDSVHTHSCTSTIPKPLRWTHDIYFDVLPGHDANVGCPRVTSMSVLDYCNADVSPSELSNYSMGAGPKMIINCRAEPPSVLVPSSRLLVVL